MQKVLYFTAAAIPTGPELAEIAAIPVYQVGVRNALAGGVYGAAIEPCDFVAGSPPDAYSEVATYSIANALAATQVIVADAQVIDTDDGGTVTLTVVDGAITAAVYAAAP